MRKHSKLVKHITRSQFENALNRCHKKPDEAKQPYFDQNGEAIPLVVLLCKRVGSTEDENIRKEHPCLVFECSLTSCLGKMRYKFEWLKHKDGDPTKLLPAAIELLECLLELNKDQVFKKCNNQDDTLLHVACEIGVPLSFIKVLIKAFPGAVFISNKNKESPGCIAERYNRKEISRFIERTKHELVAPKSVNSPNSLLLKCSALSFDEATELNHYIKNHASNTDNTVVNSYKLIIRYIHLQGKKLKDKAEESVMSLKSIQYNLSQVYKEKSKWLKDHATSTYPDFNHSMHKILSSDSLLLEAQADELYDIASQNNSYQSLIIKLAAFYEERSRNFDNIQLSNNSFEKAILERHSKILLEHSKQLKKF